MSNNDSTSTYRVEVPETYVDVKGTGFHLDAGHLLIEDNTENVAAFSPGQWLAVEKVVTDPNETTVVVPDGVTIEDVNRALERMNDRNINTLGGFR